MEGKQETAESSQQALQMTEMQPSAATEEPKEEKKAVKNLVVQADTDGKTLLGDNCL